VISAFLDGTAVPGAWDSLFAAASGENSKTIAASGIATNVPAGTHTLQVEVKPSGALGVTNSENLHVIGVALGNG
jgi:hypothetical protein